MIITKYEEVAGVFKRAGKDGRVIPCLCTENQTTTEAILAACREHGKKLGIRIPVMIAVTVNYSHRPQSHNYSNCGDWKTGLRLFRDDVYAFADAGGVYEDVDVMLHLDHVQFDDDAELLESDLSGYSSIMFDASALPFDENIRRTAQFVSRRKGTILIEGACDEIVDATGTVRNALTTPENAVRYMNETGVDLIVANLGTEHRASGKDLRYHGELAAKIKERVGSRIVLHGTSSVTDEQVRSLYADGVCKVNIWTALERDSAKPLFYEMVKNASKAGGEDTVARLIDEGYLTEKCRTGDRIDLGYFTAKYRQGVVFEEMKRIVGKYLDMWYV